MRSDHLLSLQSGMVVKDRYEIQKCLGAGSMGMVYSCLDRELGQLVALKVLFAEVARDETATKRFKQEIVASYHVSHPNVVRAFEYFREGDLVAFTMEYIGGGDLADRLGTIGVLPIGEVVDKLIQMGAGVQAIHDQGIIHRDLKPENILLTKEGHIKITDFGIARTPTGPRLTEHGGVVGTIDYVSPEYLERGHVDMRSDIYSLGILAYEMITGQAPFKGKSMVETMTMRLRNDPLPPSAIRRECPPSLDAVVLKAMKRQPDERYQSAREMLRDLELLRERDAAILGGSSDNREGSYTPLTPFEDFDGRELEGDKSKPTVLYSDSVDEGSPRRSNGPLANDRLKANVAKTEMLDTSWTRTSPERRTPLPNASHIRELSPPTKLEQLLSPGPPPVSRGLSAGQYSASRSVSSSAVDVSQAHLSPDRIKELVRPHQTETESVFKTLVWWFVIVLVGFGCMIWALLRYRPDLFGLSPRNGGSAYYNFE